MTRRLPSACECKAEIAEVGADDVLNLRQLRRACAAGPLGCAGRSRRRTALIVAASVCVFEPKIDRGQNAARNGQQMRRELDLICCQMELLEQLAGVAMAEDRVGGEIVGGIHEVGLGGRCFAGSADSGLCVADDAVVEIDQTGLQQAARARG